MLRASWLVLALASMVCTPPKDDAPDLSAQNTSNDVRLGVEEVASGLDQPVYVTAPVSDPRLFIVEQPGRIRVVENGRLLDKPFLDIVDKVRSGGEQGLLSVAFHPQYRSNGFLFVNHTDKNGDTRIERYTVSTDRNVADPRSAKVILSIDQRYSNHQGGLNLFGPDGMLYIGMGDGGSQGDPHGNGQNRNALLAKLLRINVDRGEPYLIPAANPYAKGGGRAEIWAIGLRNPWRFSFDRFSGLLYIADVGGDRFEEVNVVPMSIAGVNYGWNVMEGPQCSRSSGCDQTGLQKPALSYATHENSTCAIIGGSVYRGQKIPEIKGQYFYSDYCNSWLRSFGFADGKVTDQHEWPIGKLGSITSFGEDAQGELYICTSSGRVYRIIKSPANPAR
ncbi:MAG TPA: PQQ-dependent sugar dehydrogenase [Gemmatimonadaceae bacterium]|nr:PQQ-dependent sugar dehydrogenase [Gemmatimonadaceae bacterium]